MKRRIIVAFAMLVALIGGAPACAGDDDRETTPPAPTATSSTQSAEHPGADGFRDFAGHLDAAVHAGDVAFITGRLKTERVICEEDDVPPPHLDSPRCSFVGETFEGFTLAHWRSEGGLVPATQIEEQLRDRFVRVAMAGERDEFTDGRPQVYAITASDQRYAALLTAMIERPSDFAGEGPLRVAIDTQWEFDNGRWVMIWMMNAYVLADEFLRPDDVVRTYYPLWQRFPE
jgi:hypothetical protein